jgi:hypothetical protein
MASCYEDFRATPLGMLLLCCYEDIGATPLEVCCCSVVTKRSGLCPWDTMIYAKYKDFRANAPRGTLLFCSYEDFGATPLEYAAALLLRRDQGYAPLV